MGIAGAGSDKLQQFCFSVDATEEGAAGEAPKEKALGFLLKAV